MLAGADREAIGDVTAAAGWDALAGPVADPRRLEDIRLVMVGEEEAVLVAPVGVALRTRA